MAATDAVATKLKAEEDRLKQVKARRAELAADKARSTLGDGFYLAI